MVSLDISYQLVSTAWSLWIYLINWSPLPGLSGYIYIYLINWCPLPGLSGYILSIGLICLVSLDISYQLVSSAWSLWIYLINWSPLSDLCGYILSIGLLCLVSVDIP